MATIAGIDIGSTKICAIIAEKKDGDITITGTGISRSQGLKKGAITNIDLAAKSIKQAMNDAKRVAGVQIQSAIISISGTYTKSFNSNGIVSIPEKEITYKEINRAIQTALYNANIPSDYEILHALPYNFKVDDQDFIEDPVGMTGGRLEVSVHIITTVKSNLENLRRTIKLAGIDIDNIVLGSYASSIAVLNEDERELGVAVIDIGGATSNLAVHLGSSLRYTDFMAIGSQHITSDLSMALHTPLQIAEKIKTDYGTLTPSSNEVIEVPVIGDEGTLQQVSLEVVSNVIYARVEETLLLLAKSLEKSGFKNSLGAGVVLTGGMTKLEGLRELASAVFDNLPVRFAKPREVDGLFDSLRDPAFSAAIGLILYGFGEHTLYEIDSNKTIKIKTIDLPETKLEELKEPFVPSVYENGTTLALSSEASQPKSDRIAPRDEIVHAINPRRDSSVKQQWDTFVGWLTRLF